MNVRRERLLLALLRYRDVERAMIAKFHWRMLKHDYLHFALLFDRHSGSFGGMRRHYDAVYRSTVIGSNQTVDWGT